MADQSKPSPHETRDMVALRGALLLWLDARDALLCDLSCEDGEWPEDPNNFGSLKEMKRALAFAWMYAERLAADPQQLIWEVLNELAAKFDYTVQVNWSGGSLPLSSTRRGEI